MLPYAAFNAESEFDKILSELILHQQIITKSPLFDVKNQCFQKQLSIKVPMLS
jgi:hypothetical protein